MSAVKFSEKIIIRCDREFAFDYTQDYQNRLHWDTFLKKAELLDGAVEAGPGVKAFCVTGNGLGMVTEYVSFNKPAATAIRMIKGPYMFKSFFGSWTFKQRVDQHTEVIFLYSFELRFPFNLFSGLFKTILKSNVRMRLSDLKRNIENHNKSIEPVKFSS